MQVQQHQPVWNGLAIASGEGFFSCRFCRSLLLRFARGSAFAGHKERGLELWNFPKFDSHNVIHNPYWESKSGTLLDVIDSWFSGIAFSVEEQFVRFI